MGKIIFCICLIVVTILVVGCLAKRKALEPTELASTIDAAVESGEHPGLHYAGTTKDSHVIAHERANQQLEKYKVPIRALPIKNVFSETNDQSKWREFANSNFGEPEYWDLLFSVDGRMYYLSKPHQLN